MRLDFSVVIPFYNKSFELNLVLKGLSCQDYEKDKFEVVIVDDGSENSINDLLDKYANSLNIKYIYLEHTGNRGRNRNKGVKESKGEKIILLDGDIIPESNLISSFYKATKDNPRLVSVGFRRLLREVDSSLLTEEAVENNCESLLKLPYSSDSRHLNADYEKSTGNKMVGGWQYLYTNCVCIPKSEFEAIGGFDEVFSANWGAEDVELGFRLFQNGCIIEMNEAANGIHIFHTENGVKRFESMMKNYDIFLRMHKHWTVELFTREYETQAIEIIQMQKLIKKRSHVVSEIQNVNTVISHLPDNVLLCGIEISELFSSDKISAIFNPEPKMESEEVFNWFGMKTDYKDNHFELALLSIKYKEINYGLFHILYNEISRIAKKVVLVDDNSNILSSVNSAEAEQFYFPKEIIFYVSAFENYSIYRHYINLAIALHKKGIKTGYNVYFDPTHEINPNRGVMHTNNNEKIEIINKLLRHEMSINASQIISIVDKILLKAVSKNMGARILWDEINYHGHEKEFGSDITSYVDAVCPRRAGDMEFYNESKLIDYIPVGIDKQKIIEIKATDKAKKDKFTFLWSDQYTDKYSNLEIILQAFTELFKDKDDVELKIIHTGKNIVYSSYDKFFYQESFDRNYADLYNKYQYEKNIKFIQAELSEEEYSQEIFQCDCLINLNSLMKINSWVLESVAFGKKPIILDNGNYDGYISDKESFRVSTEPVSVLVGKTSKNDGDVRNTYQLDVPIKESIIDVFQKIYNNKESLDIDISVVNDFVDRHDWMAIAEMFVEII